MRIIVEIPEAQLESLAKLCRRGRISRAEASRRAVAKMLNDQPPMEGGMAAAFGLRKDLAGEARSLRNQVREEWR